MLTRKLGNGFEVQDWTEELNIIQRPETLLERLGIFRAESVQTTSISFDRRTNKYGLIKDVARGGALMANQDSYAETHAYNIPYFKVIDRIGSQDIQNKRAYGSASTAETIFNVLERKMTSMLNSAAITQEAARWEAIVKGKIFAPNGTVAHTSFYDDFGLTRKEVNFELLTPSTKIANKIEEVIAHIQSKVKDGDSYSGVVTFCSPEYFTKLVSHNEVQVAFQYYQSQQSPLRERLGGDYTKYRSFVWHGMTFIEVRDGIGADRFIPANEAYSVALDTRDTFLTYYAPSNKVDFVNTLGEKQYFFSYDDFKGEGKDLELEFSHINLVRRPDAVVKLLAS